MSRGLRLGLPPPLSSSPNSAIIIRRLMKNLNKRGVKRMLPLGCLPLWGKKGVTLLAAAEKVNYFEKEDFNKAHITQYQILSH
jgi:hypothetical protein